MRLLVKEVRDHAEKQAIKYTRVKEGALPEGWRNPWVFLYQTLPPLPSGIWNVVDLRKVQEGYELAYSNLKTIQWHQTVQPWHDTQDLFGSRLVLMKIAETPNDMESIAREKEVYRAIQGMSIAPIFLGHIHEDDRVVGFPVEHLQDCPHPDGKDYDACKVALGRLHSSGYLHGDAHAGNFLVQPDGTALSIDFESSQRCDDAHKFEQEQEELRQELIPEQDGTLKLEFHA